MDAGDEFVNFWGGKPVAKALQLIGTDVLTLGNHEFDWGKEFLEETIAPVSFLCCALTSWKRYGQAD